MSRAASRIRTLFLVCVLTFPAASFGAESGATTPLYDRMEDMGRALRVLNRILNSADPGAARTDALAALQKMQTLAVEAKALTPATVEELPEAERPAALVEYRTAIAATIETMLQLERAALADEWAKAKELMQQLRMHRKEGHKKFHPEEEH